MKRILLFAVLIAMAAVSLASGEGAPEWADVTLNLPSDRHGLYHAGK